MKFTVDTEHWTITPQSANGDSAQSWFDEAGFNLLSDWWLQASWQRKFSYQFRWLGRPIIQLPTDVMLVQDLIYRIRPTLTIETGIAHGGSLVLHASLLRLVHGSCTADRPHAIGIDVKILPHNRAALNDHPLRSMITLVEGDSSDPRTIGQIREAVRPDDRVLVILDSSHTRNHVLAELNAFGALVSAGSAIVVMDGIVPRLARLPGGDRAWECDNPQAAIAAFLQSPQGRLFRVDRTYDAYALTHSPGGVLVRQADRAAHG